MRRSCPACEPIWGYDGIFPGPTIEARRGRRSVVRHRNELPVPTVVHLHGGHDRRPSTTAGRSDLVCRPAPRGTADQAHGMVGDVVGASATTTTRATSAPPRSGTTTTGWTSPARQVYRGLAGFHLVRDDVEDALPLPRVSEDCR